MKRRTTTPRFRDYTAVLKQRLDWAQAYHDRGLAYSYSGRHDLAIPDYAKAIKLDPYVASAYNARGWAYLETVAFGMLCET